ncbi:hypothetical protein CsSME_00025315 [Camellia sinensis var. sinensis]
MIPWNEITFLERWKIPNAIPPKPIVNRTIDQIVQTQGGDVFLNFRTSLPRRMSSRSSIPYRVDLPSSSRQLVSDPIESEIRRVPIQHYFPDPLESVYHSLPSRYSTPVVDPNLREIRI